MLDVIGLGGMAGWFLIGGGVSGDQLLLGIGIGLLVAAAVAWARALDEGSG